MALYAYCANDPVNHVDPSGHKVTYGNSITRGSTISVTTTIKITKKNKTKKFKCKYNIVNEKVKFEFKANPYKSILDNKANLTLAKAIKSAARSIDKNCLKGRTYSGIDLELQLHYIAYKKGIKVTSSKRADIGGTDKKKKGYDSNAWFFEGLISKGTNYTNTKWRDYL